MNPGPASTVNGVWMPTVLFAPETGITREKLQAIFAEKKVDARVFFWPLSGLSMLKPITANRNSWDIPNRALNLPSFHDMASDELSVVVNVYKIFIIKAREHVIFR